MKTSKFGIAALSAIVGATTSFASRLALAAPAAADDIRDIRAPFVFPPWWRWPLAAAAALVVVLATIWVVRWWRRRSRTLSPIERARRALAKAEGFARLGFTHEWAEIVAETLRAALALRVGNAVLPQTTAELSRAPWAQATAAGETRERRRADEEYLEAAPRLLSLLETCDLARFARAHVDVDDLIASTDGARALVETLLAPRRTPAPSTLRTELVTS